MKADRRQKGLAGEGRAAQYLLERGYEVLAHDWKAPEFRIQVDLLVRNGGRGFVVEVKNHRWTGSGFERLVSWKQRERLILYARKLHQRRYLNLRWGFLWIWVNGGSCQILECHEF